MKYRGGKPRGFAVLTARPKTGRAVASEFNVYESWGNAEVADVAAAFEKVATAYAR